MKVTAWKWLRKIRAKNLMAWQRGLYEWILGNANLWAGQRSLIVGHSGKPFFRRIKERIKNMQQTVYNPQKGRLETIDIDFTDENTTWFDECEDSHGVFSITDLQAGILIKKVDYTYPLYVYDVFTEPISIMITAEQEHCTSTIHRQVKSMVIGQNATQVKLQLPFG